MHESEHVGFYVAELSLHVPDVQLNSIVWGDLGGDLGSDHGICDLVL